MQAWRSAQKPHDPVAESVTQTGVTKKGSGQGRERTATTSSIGDIQNAVVSLQPEHPARATAMFFESWAPELLPTGCCP